MNAAEKILKDMETPEGKARMNKWVEEYIAKEKVKSEKIKSMMSNTAYIEWLNQFTQDKDGFSDDDWLYFPEKISESDRENVEKLCLFYEGIDKYSQKNHIYPIPCEFGNFYRVKLNNFGFEIGILVGQVTVFFFNKASLEDDKKFIDFNDIIIGKKQDNVDQINATLDSLSNMVITAYESGVPIEAIVSTLDNTIKGITSKKEDKPKTLVRKQRIKG